jgi:hypothetical protein
VFMNKPAWISFEARIMPTKPGACDREKIHHGREETADFLHFRPRVFKSSAGSET